MKDCSMLTIYTLSLLLLLLQTLSAFSENPPSDGHIINTESNRSAILYEQLIQIESSFVDISSGTGFWWRCQESISDSVRKLRLPSYPDKIYKKRIEQLNKTTPIKLEFNEPVLKYIEAYGLQNRGKLRTIISVSSYYFPIFEEYLAKYNLPLELKYLAAVESALNPNAVSQSGAVGLWQFMLNTSNIFDLDVNSYIDERRDVFKSTDAACRYLDFLYKTFNDWQLALAAYNGGPGMVTRAIARSEGKTCYWELRPYFTEQMQNYVPAFIAMTYLMNYHAEHNLFPDKTVLDFYNYDTIMISGPLSFKQIEKVTGYPEDSIAVFNPIFIKNIIPEDQKTYSLVLPRKHIINFLANKHLAYRIIIPEDVYHDIKAKSGEINGRELVYHKVLRGETLNRLSIRYGVTVNNILAWNNLPDDYILRFDDTLKIWVENIENNIFE
jgi:membrane-bound lytic murein transglycosylase D